MLHALRPWCMVTTPMMVATVPYTTVVIVSAVLDEIWKAILRANRLMKDAYYINF